MSLRCDISYHTNSLHSNKVIYLLSGILKMEFSHQAFIHTSPSLPDRSLLVLSLFFQDAYYNFSHPQSITALLSRLLELMYFTCTYEQVTLNLLRN